MSLPDPGAYPARRPRRARLAPWRRRLVAETRLDVADLIWPVFVIEGENRREPVESMPGVERLTIDLLVEAAHEAAALGIPCLLLFPVVPPGRKSADGAEAWRPDNLLHRAVRALRAQGPADLGLAADVALDPYTSHGHDGLRDEQGRILNDATVEALTRQARAQAEAGIDMVAPSDMMDGRVGAIRGALDRAGFADIAILSYAAKYASAFYGPFRDAVGSAGHLAGDKRSYQMDPANGREALLETALDVAEGADLVMVKPGLPYLDVIARLSDHFPLPVLAYQVSGEYAMLKSAAEAGRLDFEACLMESLLGFKRAGATAIASYAARELAARLRAG